MTMLDTLKGLSAAEDFFSVLGVPYDPAVLRVARLHILRRMGEYLSREDLTDLTDAAVTERARADLERAYGDFVASSPLEQRVFKVLKDAVRPSRRAFVPLSDLDVRKTKAVS
ncbi:MAG: nitrogenase stabilizing/protective protein NifW [Zavarzinia sp.]|nr:nitrogenase stabilizing/protective protein NifW [Zavarzinia sp.]